MVYPGCPRGTPWVHHATAPCWLPGPWTCTAPRTGVLGGDCAQDRGRLPIIRQSLTGTAAEAAVPLRSPEQRLPRSRTAVSGRPLAHQLLRASAIDRARLRPARAGPACARHDLASYVAALICWRCSGRAVSGPSRTLPTDLPLRLLRTAASCGPSTAASGYVCVRARARARTHTSGLTLNLTSSIRHSVREGPYPALPFPPFSSSSSEHAPHLPCCHKLAVTLTG